MNIKLHEKALKDEVFFTKTKWPHFDLLFKNLNKLSKKIKKDDFIISLERSSLYGKISLFAPYFSKGKFISVDCTSKKLKSRGSYNKKFTNNKNIIKNLSCYSFDYKNINLKKNNANLVIIPNLMHHVDDSDALLNSASKLLKKNGMIYIFEPLLRELHQMPEDYGRFTPYILEKKLAKVGFKKIKYEFTGGPFTSIAYFVDQAIQYFPKQKRLIYEKKFRKEFPKLLKYDKKYKSNKVRKNTLSPVAFSITAIK